MCAGIDVPAAYLSIGGRNHRIHAPIGQGFHKFETISANHAATVVRPDFAPTAAHRMSPDFSTPIADSSTSIISGCVMPARIARVIESRSASFACYMKMSWPLMISGFILKLSSYITYCDYYSSELYIRLLRALKTDNADNRIYGARHHHIVSVPCFSCFYRPAIYPRICGGSSPLSRPE